MGCEGQIDSVTTEDIISKYKECFTGIECLDREHEIKLDPSVEPAVKKAREILLSMTNKVMEELQKMGDLSTIAKVYKSTE